MRAHGIVMPLVLDIVKVRCFLWIGTFTAGFEIDDAPCWCNQIDNPNQRG